MTFSTLMAWRRVQHHPAPSRPSPFNTLRVAARASEPTQKGLLNMVTLISRTQPDIATVLTRERFTFDTFTKADARTHRPSCRCSRPARSWHWNNSPPRGGTHERRATLRAVHRTPEPSQHPPIRARGVLPRSPGNPPPRSRAGLPAKDEQPPEDARAIRPHPSSTGGGYAVPRLRHLSPESGRRSWHTYPIRPGPIRTSVGGIHRTCPEMTLLTCLPRARPAQHSTTDEAP
ncbi:hypothetical protein QE381_002203 [Microbacterium sp. SORGH_AS 888]|nr:hypothetical protein [Microbacterium sp. SORGH_AS_0888]